MKKMILVIAAMVIAMDIAHGQGAVALNNRVTGVVDVRLVLANGSGAGAGWIAQLYGAAAGTPTANLKPLTPTTTFRTSSAAAMGYVNAVDVIVPGVPPGAQATLILRGFQGSSFETASLRYESNPFTVTLGGGTLPPANLVGLQRFSVVPSVTLPTITTEPQSQTLKAGSSVTFTVVAAGTPPLRYQWNKNETPIPGATSATLTLNNVSTADLGTYTVTVSNAGGAVTSSGALLSSPVDLNSGAVVFNNRITGVVDVRVILPDGTGAGAGWTAQLYGGAEGASLTPLFPTTTFRTSSAAAMGYVNQVDVTVPGVKPGTRATIVMRVFNGTSFETSPLRYESNPFTITLGGGTLPPASLVGLTSFKLVTDAKPFVERQLPAGYSPGAKLTVVLQASPPTTANAYAVEDFPPANWVVGPTSDGGTFDAANRKVKFGPFFDRTARTLTYDVTPPLGESGTKSFTGTASADGLNSPVAGADSIAAAALHPADNNPANGRVSIEEVTAYGAAWRKGTIWSIGPNPIPIDYVTRAATLWKNGESYVLDSKISAPPLWWVNTPSVKPAGLQGLSRMAANSAGHAGSAVSFVPPLFVPGEPVTVHLSIAPAANVSAYAVQDQIPAGWMIDSISHNGEFDAVNGQVKWGPFFDQTPRELICQLRPSADAAPSASFVGFASFDGANVAVTGQRQTRATSRLNSSSFARKSNGEFQIHASGRLRDKIVIEATSDLANWIPVPTVVNPDGTISFKDPAAETGELRFYRISAQ